MTLWLSTRKMTISVDVSAAGIIVAGAPIVRRFIGQPIANLRRWMRGHGGYREEAMRT